MGEVQHLDSAWFDEAEASLLWYKDMLNNGRQAVLYQALAQLVEVTQKGIGLKLFWIDASFRGFRRATTTNTCLQSLGESVPTASLRVRISWSPSQDFIESSRFPVFQIL